MKVLKKYINYYLRSSILILILTTISNILSISHVYFFKNIIDNLVINAPVAVTLKWVGIVFVILIIDTIKKKINMKKNNRNKLILFFN